ncbi:MAG: hypothetical protein JJ831_01905 [Prochlorococcus marinus XMU1422]|nr:hypothetical protein [Prochlorococcus marinus XMU1428]MBO6990210.1 hypothetical protein [Prochlorococcus marinus XMU1421]MBO7012056.1 hypothetical protein [Prochlorococcus marinus XMU1422]MCR8541086.1 hypothetical protein [Prochlorococcus marinus XMU1423]|tara:strand:- start:107 stop:628 length:522 start_codon:yes stop_codon:yes gene_type:complete
MEKNNSNIDFSEKDESPYLKYLKEGTKKFYENDFSGSLKLLNMAIRLGCNDRYVFWRRGCAKSRLGDHKGANSDFRQFGTHLETEYMHKLLKDKVSEKSNFTDECVDLIVCSLNSQELKVITNRFGLVDGIFRTQREVGTFLGITRQRVSQIESKAIKKIMIAKSLENLFEKK